MILKFDDYINLYEGVQSVISLSDAKRILEPLGWTFTRGTGDGCKFSKGKYVVYFHLKHGNSRDDNRKMDVGGLDKIREYIIDEFNQTGDLTAIKSIPWKEWRLPDPFNRELRNIDPETGKKIDKKPEQNIGHILQHARMEKDKKRANELYRDAALWKVDHDSENSVYIMSIVNKFGKNEYNICRSYNDRRPLLKNWTTNYREIDGDILLGKDNMKIFKTNYHKVNPDGTLDKKIYLSESKNYLDF